ncbi:MAG: hypothetical protein HPY74_12220 [Firmicutes bacterium]|nr:hypothetical protein [Bacillota bacterium]
MKTFITLVKTGLNVNFGISALKYRFAVEKKKRLESVLIGLSILVSLGMLLFLYVLVLNSIYSVGVQLNQPEIVLTTSIIFAQVIVLIFGIFYLMSAFYFSKDVNILVPLPLKPYEVLGSKFVVVMVNEYLTILPILVPAIIIYGVRTSVSLLYWLKSIIVILFAPIIPLSISALFIIILMRFINFRKSRDLLAVVGGFLGIFIALGINLLFTNIPEGSEEEFLRNIILNQYGMINYIGRQFPPSIWATRGLAGRGLEAAGYIVLFIAVSLALSVLLLWLSNRIFYKSLLVGQEVSRKRKVLSRDEMARKYEKRSSPVASLFFREWKILLRTPVYVLNCLSGAIIGPFLLVLLMVTKDRGGGESLNALISDPNNFLYVQLIALAFMLYVSGINVTASTAVSREGQTFWISKMIPVSAKYQVMAKFLHSLSTTCLGIVLMSIILVVFIMPLSSVLPIFLLGLIGSVPLTAFNLIVDVARPKLLWHNPQEAVKQNTNALLGMLISLLILGLWTVAAVLMINAGFNNWIIFATLALLMAGLGVLSMVLVINTAEKNYSRIEI